MFLFNELERDIFSKKMIILQFHTIMCIFIYIYKEYLRLISPLILVNYNPIILKNDDNPSLSSSYKFHL